MITKFAEAFPNQMIVSTLSRQLAWSHFWDVIYLDEPLKRDFTPPAKTGKTAQPARKPKRK
jgi:hypothetical protein